MAIQSVPRPHSMPNSNQQFSPQTIPPSLSPISYPTRSNDISKSPFSSTPSSNYPIPKVGKITSVPRPVTPVITIPSISPCLPRHIESTLITGNHGKTAPSSLPTANLSDFPSPTIPDSVNTSANMGHKHAQQSLSKSPQNIQFPLRPNKFNSLQVWQQR